MLEIVKKLINMFYFRRNYLEFAQRCREPLPLFNELSEIFAGRIFRLSETRDSEDSPSKIWFIYLNKYNNGNFNVKYTMVLKISKVAPIFNIQHEFDVEHKNIDRIGPDLGYYNDNPYTKQQAELHNDIHKILTQKGYTELKKADLDEVVEGFKMPHGVTIFGKDITVETLLFRDVLDLCGRAARQRQGAK